MSSQSIDTKQVFDGLVKNALHFIDEAIKDFESGDLQQSLINFTTGVELTLKARLFLEHWTLILSDPKKADPEKFINGQFHSVGSDEAIRRLRKIVGLSVPDAAEKAFESCRVHRRKMSHFYHPEYSSGKNDKIKESIAGLELNGWGHLYVLVARNWSDEFHEFIDRFNEIDTAMLKHKEFLRGKYDGLNAQIEKEMAEGIPYKPCSLCGYPANRLEEDVHPVFNGFCQVCIGWMRFLEVTCDDCGTFNYYDMNDDERQCAGCDNTFNMEKLIEMFGGDSPGDGKFTDGYCEECHWVHTGHTVVENEMCEVPRYICLSCYEVYDEMDQCHRCGANIAGSHPDTGTYGCVECREALEEKRAAE